MKAILESLTNYPEGILLLLVALFNSFWVCYILFFKKNLRQKIYKAYFFYAISALIWVLSNAYFELEILTLFGEKMAKYMALTANITSLFAIIGFYYLSCLLKSFQGKVSLKAWSFIIFVSIATLFFNLKQGLTVTAVQILPNGNFELIFGKWNSIFFLFGILTIILGIINVILAILKNKNDKFKNERFIYVLSGISIMFISTIIFHVLFPITTNNYRLTWIPPALTSLEILLVGYAILAQRLPSLKLLLSGLFKAIFTLLLVLIVGYFFGIILFGGLPIFYSILIACIISALLYKKLINYFDFPVFYYLLGASNIKKFKEEIFKFKNKSVVYTNLVKLNNDLYQTFQKNFFIDFAEIIIVKNTYPELAKHCLKHSEILVTKEIQLQENQQKYSPKLAQELEKLGEICLPLFNFDKKLIGFFVLGHKPFHKLYTKEEIEAIQTTQCHFSTVLTSVLHSTKLQDQLEAKNQMLEKQNTEMKRLIQQQKDFINVSAHELRTPLSISQVYAEVLKPSPEVKTMQFGLQRLADRISEIVYVNEHDGKKATFNPTTVNVVEFFTELYNNFVPTMKKKSRQFSLDNKVAEEVEADLDKSKICQVVENLITNAVNFTKEKGIITLHLKTEDEKLKFAVMDNGCGVPDDTKKEIFKKFRGNHSTKDKGLGLGLYLCKSIVKMHGGKIWCEDAPLKNGAVFYVEIPLTQPKEVKESTEGKIYQESMTTFS